MKNLLASLLLTCNLSTGLLTGPQTALQVDPIKSTVKWYASKPTGSHCGTINIKSGSIILDHGQLSGGVFILDMQSIKVNDLTDGDKAKLEGNFKGNYFFDTALYPTARFDIQTITRSTSSTIIAGKLAMHGISHGITFVLRDIKCTSNSFEANANVNFNRRDWHIATSNFMYNTLIYPTIQLAVHIQANL